MRETFRVRHLWMTWAALGVVFITTTIAAAPPAAATSPQCAAAEFRQLDFWIGDWDTVETETPAGPSIARARVAPIAQGSWRAANGTADRVAREQLGSFLFGHPEWTTLVARPNLATQASSASDLAPRWFDQVPGLRQIAGYARQMRSR